MKVQKIFFFTSSSSGGGAQRQLIKLYEIFSENYDTSFFVAKGDGNKEKIKSFKKNKTINAVMKLLKELKKSNPDVLITTLPTPNLINVALKKYKLNKHHAIVRIAHYNLKLKTTKFIIKNADKIIFNSYENMDLYSQKFQKWSHKFFYLNNVVEDFKVKDFSNQSLKPPIKGIVASSLVKRKGLDILVKAMNEISEVPISIDVFGVGPEYSNLVKMCSNKNLNFKNINVDLKNIWDKYEIFLLPSISEGLSNSLLEAQANNLFSIVSNCHTGNKEVVELTENGVLFENKNYLDLKNKILNTVNGNYTNKQSQQTIMRNYSINKAKSLIEKILIF